MGLPLYIAPVESDTSGQLPPKSPANARSPIRRLRHRDSGERRRTALAAAAAYQNSNSWASRSRSASNEPGAAAPTSNQVGTSNPYGGSNLARDHLRNFIGSRMPNFDERFAAIFRERWPNAIRSAEAHARDVEAAEAGYLRRVAEAEAEAAAEDSQRQLPPLFQRQRELQSQIDEIDRQRMEIRRERRERDLEREELRIQESRRETGRRLQAARQREVDEIRRRQTHGLAQAQARYTAAQRPNVDADEGLSRSAPANEPLNAATERWELDSNTSRRATLLGDSEPSNRRLPPSPPPRRRGLPPHFARRGGRRAYPAYPAGPSNPAGARRSQPLEPSQRIREARFDGLGDRNRSLSPEGDAVWDTLLSTLTPDPQPPSVGSSFASASASAVASQQSTAGISTSTSLTAPDTAEESTLEQPCESGCENSDTEGDTDEFDLISVPLSGRPTLFPRQRQQAHASVQSYANVAATAMAQRGDGEEGDESVELWGGIGDMQRIVRSLARREDIPDNWWAEVGLSRTLSREASNSGA